MEFMGYRRYTASEAESFNVIGLSRAAPTVPCQVPKSSGFSESQLQFSQFACSLHELNNYKGRFSEFLLVNYLSAVASMQSVAAVLPASKSIADQKLNKHTCS
jgi:hypothetical protein